MSCAHTYIHMYIGTYMYALLKYMVYEYFNARNLICVYAFLAAAHPFGRNLKEIIIFGVLLPDGMWLSAGSFILKEY